MHGLYRVTIEALMQMFSEGPRVDTKIAPENLDRTAGHVVHDEISKRKCLHSLLYPKGLESDSEAVEHWHSQRHATVQT